jgi:UDP-N-acetylglucosamine--N-acetylmuramyl-(pentapeptide) pyrophosphoryl-undecaprenol N-acetylglucosamine transferase
MENVFMIAAGGTGGHFYPGLALGRELATRGHGVVFVIDRGSSSIKILDNENISYCEADFAPMPRGKNPLKWTAFAWKLFLSIMHMRRAVRDYRPRACVGMGGYVSFPLIFAAHCMGVKTALHDSNAKIGLANRICAKRADLFMLGLPTEDKLPRTVLTGTPVRAGFRPKESQEEKNYWQFATDFKINILVVGGSQGAHNLNLAAAQTARSLLAKTRRLHFLHITGLRDYEEIKELYRGCGDAEIIPYSEDIHGLMKAAHLIVSRAGASSAAEIISLKKPCVLVPYPYAADNHQYYNAKVLADKGCAELVEEGRDLAVRLGETVKKLLSTPKALRVMVESFDKAGLPDPLEAASRCASLLGALAEGKKVI